MLRPSAANRCIDQLKHGEDKTVIASHRGSEARQSWAGRKHHANKPPRRKLASGKRQLKQTRGAGVPDGTQALTSLLQNLVRSQAGLRFCYLTVSPANATISTPDGERRLVASAEGGSSARKEESRWSKLFASR